MKQSFVSKYDLPQKLRLYSGIILLVYAFTHLLNHSLGIIDLETMEKGRLVFLGLWRHPLLSWVVPACLIIHLVFVFHKLYWKTTFKGFRKVEWLQVVLGLIMPLLLISHLLETYISNQFFGIDDNYSFYLGTYYSDYQILFIVVIVIIWTHGVIGLQMYLSQKPWFESWNGLFQGIAVGLPVLAIAGITSAGKEVLRLQQDPAWFDQVLQVSNPTNLEYVEYVDELTIDYSMTYLLCLLVFFGARYVRLKGRERRKNIEIKYLNGVSISVSEGTSLLEASLKARIPHAHVCGGRGRCSTCRVQIIEGMENISPPGEEEIGLLKMVNVGNNVRLACKSLVTGACTIHPLLTSSLATFVAQKPHPEKLGVDKEIAILFSDLRGFTAMTEHKLPYDVVHVLNQYYQFMGQAIEANGGKVDKFIGDGIMALFGLDDGLKTGCAQALAAAKAMSQQLVRLNESLQNELDQPLELGMGIHCGQVVVGEMGYRNVTSITAIGDVANTSSRLEGESKNLGCELVVSDDVARHAGADLSKFPSHQLTVRGRSQPLLVYSLKKVTDWEG